MMNAHDKQNPAGQEEGSPHAGTLVRRLAPGVIDSTAAKRHYEHSAGWLARRFRTVHRLLSRFRSADDDGTGNPGFVFFERSDVHGNEQPVSGVSSEGSSTRTAPGTEPHQPVSGAALVRAAISFKENGLRTAVPDIGNAGNKPDVQKNSHEKGVSPSIQRLVQRTVSPGAVDVRPVRQRYGRIGEWIAKRSGLINRLESRMMHEENKPERHARQAAFIDVRRKTAMLGPNPDDLRAADTGRAPADAATRSSEQEGMTSPGNRAIRWRYQQPPKDLPEAHGRIQTMPVSAQASLAASPAEKNSPKNERPFPGPGYGAPKLDSPLPSPGNAPKADQLRSTGMFRLSRKRTPPVTGESTSKDAQASGQNLPAASAAGRPEQGTGESISATSFSINAGPLNSASEPVQPKFREQGAMPLAAKGTSSTSARENMILRKHSPERPTGNNRELGTAGTAIGESISAASFSITPGQLNRAGEPVQPKLPEQGTTPLAAKETSSTSTRENMILRKHSPERPAGNNKELGTAGTGARESISDASFSITPEPLNRANEPVQPKLSENGTMPLAAKETSSTSARENMILRKHSPERPTGNNREPGSPEAGTGESRVSSKTFSAVAGPLNRAGEPVQPKLPENGTTPLAAKETSSTSAQGNIILRKHSSERPAGNNREPGSPETGTGESRISGKSFSVAGPLNRASELVQPKRAEQGTMTLAARETSSTVLPDSKNKTSPASALISRATGRAVLNGKPSKPTLSGPTVETGHGPVTRDDHARSVLRTLFRKPVVSREIQTKRIEEYKATPGALYRERTGRFKSSPLSASDQMSLGNATPQAAGSFIPVQAPQIEPVRLMRSWATEKSEQPARQEESMAATGHEQGTAAELPAETSLARKTDIIWRKAVQTGESRSFSGRGEVSYGSHSSLPPDALMRQASAPSPPEPEITTPARTSETPAAEIDLDQLVEQVSRVIARRIDIEQERRGTGQWI